MLKGKGSFIYEQKEHRPSMGNLNAEVIRWYVWDQDCVLHSGEAPSVASARKDAAKLWDYSKKKDEKRKGKA